MSGSTIETDEITMAQSAGLELEDMGTLATLGSRVKTAARSRHMLRLKRSPAGHQ